jgi:hypothetical protein
MRNGRGLAVCVAIVVTLTACNGEAARHSDESSPSDTVDGSLEPGRERTGTVTIEISAPAGENPGELASLLASLLAEEYPGALSATVSDRGNIIVVVEDISEPEAADLERLLDGPELASMRAVRSLEDCDAEPDVELLGASDGTTLCVALLGVSNPFERGSTSIGESSLSVTIRQEKRDEVNALFTQCFEAESSCPAIEPGTPVGRVAVVFDSTVVFAAAANIPEVDSRISLSGPYTRDELTDLAATLNSGSIERFDVVDATWDPDS